MNTRPTDTLTIHPAAAAQPGHSAEDLKTMTASVLSLGILDALKICDGQIVDGRLRYAAAIDAGIGNVPVAEISADDVFTVLFVTLTARRHFTKSALAYIGFPLLHPVLIEARRRAINAARSFVRGSDEGQYQTFGNTVEEIAESHGISRHYFFRAAAIRKRLDADAGLRAEWEPQILGGAVGLDQVLEALTGKPMTGGRKAAKGDAYQLMLDLLDSAATRFARWHMLNPKQRKKARIGFIHEFLPALPADLLQVLDEYIGSIKREGK